MKELLDDMLQWQTATFPTSTPKAKLHHLDKEVKELLDELNKEVTDGEKIRMEYADCFILLFGAALLNGMTLEMIQEAIQDKMTINKLRKWGKPDENGVCLHEKE